jgi:hypothetical protein
MAERYTELRDKTDLSEKEKQELEELRLELSGNVRTIRESILATNPEVIIEHLYNMNKYMFDRLRQQQGKLKFFDRIRKSFTEGVLSKLKPEEKERLVNLWDVLSRDIEQLKAGDELDWIPSTDPRYTEGWREIKAETSVELLSLLKNHLAKNNKK